MHIRQDVRVEVQGDGDAGVPEHFGHHLGVDVLREQDRRASVSKIMEAYLRKPRPLKQGLETARREVAAVKGLPHLGGEYEAALAPQGAYPIYLTRVGVPGGS